MIPCIFNLGTGEIIVILVVILLLFGAKRIPELARSLGKGVNSFKQGMNDAINEVNKPSADATDKQQPTSSQNDEKTN